MRDDRLLEVEEIAGHVLAFAQSGANEDEELTNRAMLLELTDRKGDELELAVDLDLAFTMRKGERLRAYVRFSLADLIRAAMPMPESKT